MRSSLVLNEMWFAALDLDKMQSIVVVDVGLLIGRNAG
jgi:hypothetical protein